MEQLEKEVKSLIQLVNESTQNEEKLKKELKEKNNELTEEKEIFDVSTKKNKELDQQINSLKKEKNQLGAKVGDYEKSEQEKQSQIELLQKEIENLKSQKKTERKKESKTLKNTNSEVKKETDVNKNQKPTLQRRNSVGGGISEQVNYFKKKEEESKKDINHNNKIVINGKNKKQVNKHNDLFNASIIISPEVDETHFITLKLDKPLLNLTGKFISQSLICELTTNDNQYSTYYLKLKHKNDSLENKQIFDIVILNFSELTKEEIENEKRNLVEQYYNDPENKDNQKIIVRITVLDKNTKNLHEILKIKSGISKKLATFPLLEKIDIFCSLGTDMQNISDLNSGYPMNCKLGIDAFLKWCVANEIKIKHCLIAGASADFMNFYEEWSKEKRNQIIDNGANIYSDWHINSQVNPVFSLNPNDWIKRKILTATFIHLLMSGVTPSSKEAAIYKHRIYTNKEVSLGTFKIVLDICKKLNNEKILMHADYKVTLVKYNNDDWAKKGHEQSVYYGFLHPDEMPKEEHFLNDLMILQILNSQKALSELMGPDNEYKKVSTQLWNTYSNTKEGVQKLSKEIGKSCKTLITRTYYFPWKEVGQELYKKVVGNSPNNNNNAGHKKIETIEVDLTKLNNDRKNNANFLGNGTTIVVQSKVGDFTL